MKKLLSLIIPLFLFACKDKTEKLHPLYSSISESVYASGSIKSKNQYLAFANAGGDALTRKVAAQGVERGANAPAVITARGTPKGGGSIVIFLLALEMVLGKEIFHNHGNPKAGTLVPIAFPLIAGAGTLTTIMSLKATYENSGKNEIVILVAIIVNLIVVYAVLKSLKWIQKVIGVSGLIAVRKFFGVILLAISIQIFVKNIGKIGF